MNTQITKLFNSGNIPRAHLWLQGQRLLDAGFKPGDVYTQVWADNELRFVRNGAKNGLPDNSTKTIDRKVNRQKGNPAIRVEGKRVHDLFGKRFSSVKVTYENDMITVVGAEQVGAETV